MGNIEPGPLAPLFWPPSKMLNDEAFHEVRPARDVNTRTHAGKARFRGGVTALNGTARSERTGVADPQHGEHRSASACYVAPASKPFHFRRNLSIYPFPTTGDQSAVGA